MATDKNMLKLKSPGTATVEDLPKVGQNYYGIEFTRNTSNNGGSNGYHKMIGSDEMLAELPVHNLLKVCAIKDAKISQVLNQTNWYKDEDGNDVDLAGGNGEDFMLTLTKPVYAIMGGTDATYDRYIVGLEPFSYGGDVAQKIEPFAECVDLSTRVDNMQRCIYDASVVGSMGTQASCITEGFSKYLSSGGFPRTSTTRFNYELYARNKNEDTTGNLPYCNSLSMDLSFWMTMMYIECRTKWLNSVFGQGVSSNSTPTASTFGTTMSGVRITEADGTEHYYALSNTSVYTNGENGTRICAFLTGGTYPLMQIMEAQRDVSNGLENGEFVTVTCPDGTPIKGVDDGVMTGMYRQKMTGKINCAFASGDEDKECTIEVVLVHPVWRGKSNNWGNAYTERSGSEVLLYIDEDGNRQNILFQAKSVEDVMTDTDTTNKENKEDWAFVGKYEELGDIGSTSGNRSSIMRTEGGVTHPTGGNVSGGGLTSYESAYVSVDTSTTTTNVWIRRWVVFGGLVYDGSASLRICNANSAPSNSGTNYGGGFRCKVAV